MTFLSPTYRGQTVLALRVIIIIIIIIITTWSRSFAAAGVPITKESFGLLRRTGKATRPMVERQVVMLGCHRYITCPLAERSPLCRISSRYGSKVTSVPVTSVSQLQYLRHVGLFNASARHVLNDLGRRISWQK